MSFVIYGLLAAVGIPFAVVDIVIAWRIALWALRDDAAASQ